MLESFQRRQDLQQLQERARMRDRATVLDGFGAILLHNMFLKEGDKAIHMKEVFPDLYTDSEAGGSQAAQSAAADMELYKAQRLHHAYCFNKNRGRSRQNLEKKD